MKARKRFGQHFLTDPGVLERIVAALAPGAADQLLEIGPGHGALTALLHDRVARYVAVEIDRDLIAGLEASFAQLEVVNADILRVPLETLLAGSWRVVGNLPYNISSPLLLKLYGHAASIRDMHFMFQRELAARLHAQPGTKDWGRLSVVTQYHCEVEPLFDVAPEAFRPPPRVHSRVVRIVPRPQTLPVDRPMLDQVLRMAFSARRKRISNALRLLEVDWDRTGLSTQLRPDQLDVEAFVSIANAASRPQ